MFTKNFFAKILLIFSIFFLFSCNGEKIEEKSPERIKFENIKKENISFLKKTVFADSEQKKIEKLKIDFISPKGKIDDLTKNITVRFNKPVIAFTFLDNQKKCPIKFIPKLKGKCVWITTSTFQFRPESGFAIGGKYKIIVGKNFKSINKEKLEKIETFEIETPKFEVLSVEEKIKNSGKIKIIFNALVDLEEVKKNLEIKSFTNKENFKLEYQKKKNELGVFEEQKNVVLISNSKNDWGYEKKYDLVLQKGLKNIRGNIGLEKEIIKKIQTNSFLEHYGELILKDENKDFGEDNIYHLENEKIITTNNPIIGFAFSENFPKNKDLIEIFSDGKKIDYEFYTPKGYEKALEKEIKRQIKMLENSREFLTQQEKNQKIDYIKNLDKRLILIKLNKNLEENSSLIIKIKASKVSSSKDLVVNLKTSKKNKVVDFKFINYKLSCIYFEKELYDNYYFRGDNKLKNFEFLDEQNNKAGKIISLREIYKGNYGYNYDGEECEYKEGFFGYELNTLLTPEKQIKLKIKKELIDKNIYPLDKDYIFSFKTGKIKNKDKFLDANINGELKIFPKNSKEFPLVIYTKNLDKVEVEVCNSSFDILSEFFVGKDKNCIKKIIKIKNNGFENTTTIINLEEIFSKKFDKQVVYVKVSKLLEDRFIKLKRDYYYNNPNFFEKSFLINSVNVIVKNNFNKQFLWIFSLENGKNLKVSDIKKIENFNKKYDYNTRKNFYKKYGEVSFKDAKNGLIEINGKTSGNYFLVTLKTGEKILIANPGKSTSIPEKIFIFTDKPIYKPGDTIHIKGFVRKDKSEKLELPKNKNVILSIRDSKYYDILKYKKITLNENSGFEYDFVLKDNASLGEYTLKINNKRYNFLVEKYEKPDFKIDLKSDKKIYKTGEKAKINVLGEYYLGASLANGLGKYSIYTKKYHFKPKDFSDYLWGENKNYFYKCFFYNPIIEKFKFLKRDKFVLNNFGKKDLEIDLDSEENKIFKIDISLGDPKTKKTVSKNIELTVLNSDIFAGMKFNKNYFSYKDKVKIDFITVDKNGKKIKNVDLEFSVKTSPLAPLLKEEGNKKKEKILFEKKLKTDEFGQAKIDYEIKDFGEITFEIKAKNNNFKTTKTFYIYGNDKIKKEENAGKLNIFPEKQEYKIGEKAKINIFSDLKGKALITIEKQNKIFETKIVDIEKPSFVYEFEIKKEYLPNFYVSAILVGKNSTKYESGEIIVRVNKQNIKLNTKVLTDKKEYLPGDKQIIELEIKDFEGKNIDGEATIAIVDESLLALKKRDSKNIIDYFYDKKSNNIRTNNLLDLFVRPLSKVFPQSEKGADKKKFSRGFIMQKSANLSLKSLDSAMPVSESLAGDSAMENPNSTKIRTDFKDIAHFFGTIKVKNGKAKVVVDKLPDNLTTWIIDGFVITKDTRVGTIKKSFKVKKDLSIIPSLPRFFMLNDEFEIKTVVINNLDKDLEINPILEISNAKILTSPQPSPLRGEGVAPEKITVAKNSQKVIKWKVKINNKPSPQSSPLKGEGAIKKGNFSEIKITIKSGKLVDSVILKREIKAYSTPETVFTNGKTTNISYEEKIFLSKNIDKDFGNLRISIGASILANLMGKIEDLIPKNIWFNSYYSVETLDKIASIMNLYKIIGEEEKLKQIKIYEEITKRYYTLPEVVKKSLEELKFYISYNGGIKYSKNCYSNYCTSFDLSVKTLKVLNKLSPLSGILSPKGEKEAAKIKKNLKKYIKEEIKKQTSPQPSPQREGVAPEKFKDIGSLIVLAQSGEEKFVLDILDKVEFGESNIDKLNEIKLYRILKIKKEKREKLLKSLKNNVLIEARGTIIKSGNYTNDISTALGLIEFLENGETEKLLIENFARFLVSNHLGENSFGKSVIIDALAKYVEKTKELDGVNFVGKGYLRYRKIIEKKFDKNNKFEVYTKNFPIKDYIELGKNNSLGFKKDGKGVLYYDVNLTYFLPIEEIKPRDEGLIISRKYYKLEDYLKAYKKECYFWRYYGNGDNCYYRKIKEIDEVKKAKTGEMLVGEIELITPRERSNVVIENFIPAGAEIMNSSLDVTPEIVKQITGKSGGYYGFSSIENYEDKVFMFAPKLYSGSYKYTYVIKINHAGKFHNKPAIGYLLDKPEIWGRTGGEFFEVGE